MMAHTAEQLSQEASNIVERYRIAATQALAVFNNDIDTFALTVKASDISPSLKAAIQLKMIKDLEALQAELAQ